MVLETYMLLREHGPASWTRLLPTLFVSDRVSTWLPSGHDIQKAYEKGLLPFSYDGFLELIRAGIIRVAGRDTSYDPRFVNELMFPYDTTDPIQRFFRDNIEIGHYSDILYLHRTTDAEANQRIAHEEIRNRRNPEPAGYHIRARNLVDQYLNGSGVLHPMVVRRAREFAEMEPTKIVGQHMRDCVRYIDRYAKSERTALHLTFQLIRLSLEHGQV
jgi:hypothetical protein